jgi:Cd2+/Zn2+-exporting ATPase
MVGKQHRLVAEWWARRGLRAIRMVIPFGAALVQRQKAPPPGTGAPAAEPKTGSASRPPTVAAIQTACCALLILTGWALRAAPASTAAFVGAYLAGGAGPVAAMLDALRRRQLGVDLLMIVAALGAAYLGDWAEGAVLLFLFSLSGTLEAYAFYRSRRSIESLIRLRPHEALRVRDGEEVRVAIASLVPGDRVRVRSGERIPVDGEVIEGETSADESTLTGRADPSANPSDRPCSPGR